MVFDEKGIEVGGEVLMDENGIWISKKVIKKKMQKLSSAHMSVCGCLVM